MNRLIAVFATMVLLASIPPLARADDSRASKLVSNRDDDFGRPDPTLFKESVVTAQPAPAKPVWYTFPAGVAVVDFEVSPTGDRVAMVTENSAHRQQIAYWHYGAAGFAGMVEVPASTHIASLAWRPDAGRLFLLATDEQGSQILGLDPNAIGFTPTAIFRSKTHLRRLAVGPRPFLGNWNGPPAYRLFFGQQLAGGRFSLRTVTEQGLVPYTVVGPVLDPEYVHPKVGTGPGTTVAPSALPVAFHPSGDALIWEDSRGCLHRKPYGGGVWQKSILFGKSCKMLMLYTPNGATTLAWADLRPGLLVHGLIDGTERTVLGDNQFISVPSQTPDGKGVVGLTRDGGRVTIGYLPFSLPLADVTNAWMFLGNEDDQRRFQRDGGLFRALSSNDQIYQLYDSESYENSNNPDPQIANRPYFVTTDLFWEIYGAAFDGLFIVVERERAMPALRKFVDDVTAALAKSNPKSELVRAFAAAQAVLGRGEDKNLEARRILAANELAMTPLGNLLDYSQLEPRGHYKTEEQQRYFRAMRYLSLLRLSEADAATLRGLGPEAAKAADDWIGSYRPFIAASRLNLVWGSDAARSGVASHAGEEGVSMFPLSWAWDNEALDNVIYHDSWPPSEQIVSSDGNRRRLLPSGLDFAAILGNIGAKRILGDEGLLADYPNLGTRIAATARRFVTDGGQAPTGTLYEKWISALATQWADVASIPELRGQLWDAKRLQTGLASWATLRHSTILVNDQAGAEAGEGGFEEIVMAPPRGYVEPDPATFGAIADLFDATIAMVRSSPILASNPTDDSNVRQGIVRRLAQSRDDARRFQAIARKEIAGQPLDADDYAAIQYVGGSVEHSFLVFMSLSNPSYALSNPDPMMKVADVAGARGEISTKQLAISGSSGGSLEVAVGRPMEWDQIVPFYGRHEIVKGAIYSYYEFITPEPIDDKTWRDKVDSQARPPWVGRFLSKATLGFPATEP